MFAINDNKFILSNTVKIIFIFRMLGSFYDGIRLFSSIIIKSVDTLNFIGKIHNFYHDILGQSVNDAINSGICYHFHGTNIAIDDDIEGEWATEKCAALLHNLHFTPMYHHSGPPPQRNVQHSRTT